MISLEQSLMLTDPINFGLVVEREEISLLQRTEYII